MDKAYLPYIYGALLALIPTIPSVLIFWRQLRRDNIHSAHQQLQDQNELNKATQEAAIAMLKPLTEQINDLNQKYNVVCEENEELKTRIKTLGDQLHQAMESSSFKDRRITELGQTLEDREKEWNEQMKLKDGEIALLRKNVERLERRVIQLEGKPKS